MYKDEQINTLIDDAINQLADDDIRSGVGVLQEIAHVFAKAGLPIETFFNIRSYIVNEAKEKTDSLFIDEKIKLAEREAQNARLYSYAGQAKRDFTH